MHPVFGWPDIVRFSWGPSLEVLEKNPQAHGAVIVRWPEEEGGESAGEVQQQRDSMAAFLGRGPKRQKVPDRHRLLHEAALEPVTSW